MTGCPGKGARRALCGPRGGDEEWRRVDDSCSRSAALPPLRRPGFTASRPRAASASAGSDGAADRLWTGAQRETARTLGIDIPKSMQVRADGVIGW